VFDKAKEGWRLSLSLLAIMGFILLGAFIVCTLECYSHRADSGKDFDILDDFKFSERKKEESAAGEDGKELEEHGKRNTSEVNFG
jgi:hypothetical protein